jgi:hypothetical protein
MGLVPLAERGEPNGGGNYELWLRDWFDISAPSLSGEDFSTAQSA